jgi:hypothetical protein
MQTHDIVKNKTKTWNICMNSINYNLHIIKYFNIFNFVIFWTINFQSSENLVLKSVKLKSN